MTKRQESSKDQLLTYMRENAGRKVTVVELQENVPGWGESTYSGTMRLLVAEYPDYLIRVKRGTWMWSGDSLGKKDQEPGLQVTEIESIKLTVLKTVGDDFLVMDDDMVVYKMTKNFTL